MGSPEPVWEVVMKFKITGVILIIAGAVIASVFPLPGNLIGIPIAAIGTVITIISSPRRDWRNLR